MINLNRYMGRILCIYDYYLTGVMDRPIEKVNSDQVFLALSELYKTQLNKNENKFIYNLKDQQDAEYPNITKEDIQSYKYWNSIEILKYYDNMRREILAALKLQEVCKNSGLQLTDIGAIFHTGAWTIQHWMSGRERMPWGLVKTIEKMQDDFTVQELYNAWKKDKQQERQEEERKEQEFENHLKEYAEKCRQIRLNAHAKKF